jgi:hypothetical protein
MARLILAWLVLATSTLPLYAQSSTLQFSDDPQHAFPGHGQMTPEQLEIVRLNVKWRS